MGFLLPLALLGLGFIAAPIVAHLMRRRGIETKRLPTVALLHQAHAASKRRRQLVDLLLLLVRILLIALLALAAARPYLPKEAGAIGDEAINAVFLIDDSHSLRAREGGTTLIRRAIDQAIDDLRALPSGSVFSIVRASDPPEVLLRNSRAEDRGERVLRALRDGSSRGPGLARGIDLAQRSFSQQDHALARHLFIYSDFAAHERASEVRFQEGVHVRFRTHRANATANRALIEASLSADEESERWTIRGALRSFEGEGAAVQLLIRGDGVELERGEAILDERGEARFEIELERPIRLERLSVEFAERGDAIPDDDLIELLISGSPRPRVLVVDGDPRPMRLDSATGFFMTALMSERGAYQIRVIDEAAFDRAQLESADIVVLADIPSPNPRLFAELLERVRAGSGLLISLGRRGDPFAYGGLFNPLIRSRFLPAQSRRLYGVESIPLGRSDDEPSFGHHHPLSMSDSALPLLRSGETLLGAIEPLENGRVALLGIPLNDYQNNLPYRPIYLPIILDTMRSIAPPRLEEEIIIAGESVSLEAFFRERDSLTLESPRREKFTITKDDPVFSASDEAGIYRLFDGDRLLAEFAARVPAIETELSYGALPERPEAHEGGGDGAGERHDLTPLALGLAALLWAAEGVLRSRGRRLDRGKKAGA